MRKAGLWFLARGDYVIHTKSNGLFQKNSRQMRGRVEDMEFPGVLKKAKNMWIFQGSIKKELDLSGVCDFHR